MSGRDFVLGLVMFAAVGGPAALLSWRLVTRRLGHLDRLERAVAAGLLFLLTIVVIHVVPLALGVLSRGTVLAAAALVAVGALLVPRVHDEAPDPPRPPAPASRPLSWALAAVAALPLLVALVANVRDWLPRVFQNLDTITFHLPNVARFMQSGTLWQFDQFLPLQAQASYPNHGEMLELWAMLPFDNDWLVRWVMIGVLLIWPVVIVAAARELRAPPAAAVLAACALMTIKILPLATVPRAMPDVLLCVGWTGALLFLARHARTGRRSDLVLAGIGLGLSLGTKWYGVSGSLVLLAVWFGARLLRRSERPLTALADTGLLAAVAFASGGIWLVRNLVEASNPLFPQKVGALGVTIFDAPRDIYREKVGFTIAHYAGDPHALKTIAGQMLDGLGPLVFVLVPLALVAAIVAWRERDWRVRALLAAGVGLWLVYLFTPHSALGLEGHPLLAKFNTRYGLTALICATLAVAWAAGRLGRGGRLIEAALAGTTLASISGAYGPLHARGLALAALALGLAAAAALVVIRLVRTRPQLPWRALAAAAAAVVLVGGVAYAHRSEQRMNDPRYVGIDPTFGVLARAGPGLRVGLSGFWATHLTSPVWQAFGKRIENEVEYIGRFQRGFLKEPRDAADFRRLVRKHDYDLVIVGRGFEPPERVREQAWANSAGLVEVSRSRGLLLYAKPALAARL